MEKGRNLAKIAINTGRHSGGGRNPVEIRCAKHSKPNSVSFGRIFELDSGLRRNDN